jgi:short subunit dehydrogenase-like uncharacterized protein
MVAVTKKAPYDLAASACSGGPQIMNAKPYDIVVFGATGFVGKLLCRYLASRGSSSGLKWAAAARSREKLESLRHFLGPEAPSAWGGALSASAKKRLL